jgi:RimJ/RimL family protein N-acetyltransferase
MKNKALFLEIKKAAGSKVNFVIPVGKPVDFFLRPIATDKNKLNKNDIHLLSEWRNKFVRSFLTEFRANDERTASWLTEHVAKNDQKIMFMIDTLDNIPIGHVGLGFINWETGYVEADAIVRGASARKGLMREALRLLLTWAETSLGLDNAWVRVRSDNPAVVFYQNTGFIEKNRIPLSKKTEGDSLIWFEDPNAEKDAPALIYMKYQLNDSPIP